MSLRFRNYASKVPKDVADSGGQKGSVLLQYDARHHSSKATRLKLTWSSIELLLSLLFSNLSPTDHFSELSMQTCDSSSFIIRFTMEPPCKCSSILVIYTIILEGYRPYRNVWKAVLNRNAFILINKVALEPSYESTFWTTTSVSATTFATTPHFIDLVSSRVQILARLLLPYLSLNGRWPQHLFSPYTSLTRRSGSDLRLVRHLLINSGSTGSWQIMSCYAVKIR